MVAVAQPELSELLTRVDAGEPDAFAAVYARLAPHVQQFLRGLRLPLGQGDHEDALQETFLRLFKGLRSFDPERSLKAYALGIARHVAIDLCRRGPPPPAPLDVGRVEGPASTSDRVRQREHAALVEDALNALAPELRTALTLRHVSKLKMTELSESLGCSVPTARARLEAASYQLARELRKLGVVPGEAS